MHNNCNIYTNGQVINLFSEWYLDDSYIKIVHNFVKFE